MADLLKICISHAVPLAVAGYLIHVVRQHFEGEYFRSTEYLRSWIQLATQRVGNAQKISILTYNVLGALHGATDMHAYSPIEDRVWRIRKQRICQELDTYACSIVCLQEVSSAMLQEFSGFFNRHHKKFSAQYFDRLSTEIEVYGKSVPKIIGFGDEALARELLERNKLTPTDSAQFEDFALSYACLGCATFVDSMKYSILQSKALAFREVAARIFGSTLPQELLGELTSRTDGCVLTLLEDSSTKAHILVANTHLFWNPRRPDIKVLQAAMLADAAARFLQEFYYFTTLPSDLICVLAGDFNSVPVLQPQFLPDKVGKIWQLQGGAKAGHKHHQSGVYEFLTTGTLDASHPEHPSTFGSAPKLKALSMDKSFVNGFTCAYTKGGFPPEITTKTATFCGRLDYVFVSENAEVVELLEMPYEEGRVSEMNPIPDKKWGSDHIALGACIRTV